MSLLLAFALPASFATGPVETAVRATEAPSALRAAFTVEMRSASAERLFSYDPRRPNGERWQTVSAVGLDSELDAVAAQWAAEAAPDSRLFADNLRVGLTGANTVEDYGAALRVSFAHTPVGMSPANDATDAAAMDAEAWVEPTQGRILRLAYRLNAPIQRADGSALTQYSQDYLLESEQAWGLSYISAYKVSLAVEQGGEVSQQDYQANIRGATFFFATPALEDAYREELRAQMTAY